MRLRTLLTCLLLYVSWMLSAQSGEGMGPNTANNWNFARNLGLDFNSGYPVITPSAPSSYGGSSISDTLGQLLFYVDGKCDVYTRNHTLMENGELILQTVWEAKQNILIIPVPGSTSKYYIFTVGHEDEPIGLYYHIVDMNRNSGLGSVIVKDVKLDAGNWAQSRLNAVRHSNKTDFWVITRIVFDSCYAAFHVSPEGVNPVPVKSPARYAKSIEIRNGEMKCSPDSKLLVSLDWYTNWVTYAFRNITINSFDASNGTITEKFSVEPNIGFYENDIADAAEFSPDSKYLYVGYQSHSNPFGSLLDKIVQYDVTMPDAFSFSESAEHIITLNNKWFRDIQLAPDGKIYIVHHEYSTYGLDTLDVINKPWEKGIACDYAENVIGLQTNYYNSFEPLPNFIQEQLYRFVYNGSCANAPFTFRHRFIPEPDSIVWNFGDGTTSSVFNPVHIFQSGGIYEVHAHVVYPDGRIEETSRKVEVLAAPEPYLGNDTLMCSNAVFELDAGAGFTQYIWNEQFPPGNRYYTVTDSGFYRVKVRNDLDCYGYDTVHVALYPPVFLDISQAEISNTTCNNSTGAIRGIQVSPAAIIEWRDGSGNLVGSTINIAGLPVGNYYLTVIDTTGCITEIANSFNINNTDFDLIIESAIGHDASCGHDNGSIQVETSVFSDLLLFSSDDGTTWIDNQGNFTNLPAGSYLIRVKDSEDCEAIFSNNPVWVNDAGGPMVTFAGSTAATGSNADGTITVTASGDSLYYQLNGGTAQDTGYFQGLAPDVYFVTITDKVGCDTTVTLTVTSETGYRLSALAGNDRKCLHKIATSELKVSNLNGVKDFKATVLFSSLMLDCLGYDQKFDDDLTVTEFTDRIELEWHGLIPLALSDTVSLVHLVFETRQTGIADVDWDLAGSSYFRDENGLNIPCEPIDGEISISEPPVVVTNGDQQLCEGSFFVVISADVFLGVPPYTVEWTKPDGITDSDNPIWLFNVRTENSGEYIVKVTDQYNCVVNDTVNLVLIPPPTANFPATNPTQDTIAFEQAYYLEATPGYASYEWNTGDTTYFINVTEESEYSVIIQTTEGCTDTSYVMMINTWFPVNVPNAFTPNGDGLNDVFRPVVDAEHVRQFSMSIYNRWGQLFFETHDATKGWNGEGAMPGVYSWVITYSNVVGKVFKLKGSVALVK